MTDVAGAGSLPASAAGADGAEGAESADGAGGSSANAWRGSSASAGSGGDCGRALSGGPQVDAQRRVRRRPLPLDLVGRLGAVEAEVAVLAVVRELAAETRAAPRGAPDRP